MWNFVDTMLCFCTLYFILVLFLYMSTCLHVLFVGTLHCTCRIIKKVEYSLIPDILKRGNWGEGGSNYDFLSWTMWSEIIWSVHQGDVYNYVVKHNKAFPPIIPIGISNQQLASKESVCAVWSKYVLFTLQFS